ncbi:MAG: CRISPR-associated protein Cas4 [Tissierellaceae bacterium]|nr:CRISPR-associated protein Cas4 [Tissierellaceae bacterium]
MNIGDKNQYSDDYLLLSGIQHFIFCRRQWALIHIEQLWSENFFTIDGQIKHEKVDEKHIPQFKNGIRILRSLPVISHKLKIQGKCDVVELQPDDNGFHFSKYDRKYKVFPIEYKRGKPKTDESDKMQLLAQAMCLEEMLGLQIDEGACFYFETRRRENVVFTEDLREKLKNAINEMNNYYERKYTPKVKKTSKCKSCSLRDLCLPELNTNVSVLEYMKKRLLE